MTESKVRGNVEHGEGGKFQDKFNNDDVVEALEEAYPEPLTNKEIAQRVGCSKPTAHNRLHELADDGEVLTKKVGSKARVWWLEEAAGRPDGVDFPQLLEDEDLLRSQADMIEALIEANPEPLTNKEIIERTGCSGTTVHNRLHELADDGRVLTKKVGATARVWWVEG